MSDASANPDERPLPILSRLNRPYWDAAAAHRMDLPCCNACGKVFYPIGPVCPACFSNDLGWRTVSGRGTVSSYVVYRQAFFSFWKDKLPYAVVQVELDEGPRVNGNLIGMDPEKISIGMRVAATYERVDDNITLPHFEPI